MWRAIQIGTYPAHTHTPGYKNRTPLKSRSTRILPYSFQILLGLGLGLGPSDMSDPILQALQGLVAGVLGLPLKLPQMAHQLVSVVGLSLGEGRRLAW